MSIEAMKLALEAIEDLRGYRPDIDKAIDAIRTAIQQAEAQQPATTEPAVSRNPFASRCYTMSESHLSGHRLLVGFEKLEDAQAAHEWIARYGRCDYLHHGIPAQAKQATPRIPSDGPSTYEQRFTAAVAVICGVTPPAALVCDWINKAERHDDLQQWVGSYAPGWVQNIAVLDAAHQMADQPTEGGNHEPAQQPDTGEPVAWLDEMLADTREVFDAGGSETPQVVRDVIEYVKSWVTVYSEKNHPAPAAHPAPSVPADVVRDAERYRWLREQNESLESFTFYVGCGNGPHDDGSVEWVGADLDATIDAAMLAAK